MTSHFKTTKKEKDMLWARIEKRISSRRSFMGISIFHIFIPRFAMAGFVTLVIIASSTATVAAADSAKPGDLLFPIDIAFEKIQIVISSREKKDELKVKFSQERLKEAGAVLSEVVTGADHSATSTSPKSIRRSEKALSVALDRLEQTKTDLEERNNTVAAQAVESVIDKLNVIAEDHVSHLDEVEVKIKDNGNKIKIEIEASSKGLKNKFKFEEKDKKDHKDHDDDEENEDENEDEDDEDDSELHHDGKVTICHKGKTIKIAHEALKAHLDHKDVRGKCGDGGEGDITEPIISNVAANISTSTIRITWKTDERADSKVFYATSTPVVISSATKISSSSLVRNHSIFLLNLNASTTYYFVVSSADASGNTATSTQVSFTTLKELDVVGPVISSVSSNVSTSTVGITWNTNEMSDSSVFYATSAPVVVSSSIKVSSSMLAMTHSIFLSNLNASTTYYFFVSSADAASNTATSTEASFTTL